MVSLFEPHDSRQQSDVLVSSDAAPLSGIAVENEFVEAVYTDISPWYDYFFGPTLHAGRLESMSRLSISPGDVIEPIPAPSVAVMRTTP